jgi:L-asparagine oxygenase
MKLSDVIEAAVHADLPINVAPPTLPDGSLKTNVCADGTPGTNVVNVRRTIEDNTNHFRLTGREKCLLKEVLKSIEYDPTGTSSYINTVRNVTIGTMPRRILAALNEQRASLQPHPYLIIDNLPTDDEVFGSPRQSDSGSDFKSGCVSENVAIAVAALIGESYSISFEGREIVNNLVPEPEKADEFTGIGSSVELDFHIENAALKFLGGSSLSPMGLVLSGVRKDPAMPKTRVADVRSAIQMLDEDDRQILRGNHFQLKVPYRWRTCYAANDMESTKPVSLISGPEELPEAHVAFYPDMVTPITEAATAAFYRFHQAVKRVSFAIDITPGRLAYVDNRLALHSRDRFVANYDQDGRALRWVHRVFVAASLWNHRTLYKVHGRVFEPLPSTT